MSRTDKDRPYWVKINDRTLGTVEHHDHTKRRYSYGRRLVERGEYMLVEYGDPTWILRYTHGTPGMTPEQDAQSKKDAPYYVLRPIQYGDVYFPVGNKRWYYERPTRYEWVGRILREPQEVTDECSIDRPVQGKYDYWRFRCTVEPYSEHVRPNYDKPLTEARVKDNRARRRRSAQAMHAFVVEYNTYGEVDDSTWQDFQHRHAPLDGGYWG